MTGRRTHALAVALTLAAATLSACGGTGEEQPTTQSVEEYAQTEAAKSTSRSKPAPSASGSTTEADSTSEAGDEPPASASSSATDDPPPGPGTITDQAVVSSSKRAVRRYVAGLNRAARKPESRNALDAYTTPGCESCSSLKKMLARFDKRKQRFAGDLVAFEPSEVRTSDVPGTVRVFGTLKQLPTPVVGNDGAEKGRNKAKNLPRAFYVTTTSPSGKVAKIKGVVG